MNEETDNEFDEKAYLKRLGLKQEILSSQAESDKDLNAVADKTKKFDMGRINN